MDGISYGQENIVTALDIALDDANVHQIGRCLIHTAIFHDIGLVWPSKRQRTAWRSHQSDAGQQVETETEEEEDDGGALPAMGMRDAAELAAAGLPLTFGSSKVKATPYDYEPDPYGEQATAAAAAAAEEQEAGAEGEGASGAIAEQQQQQQHVPVTSWQQAWDASTNHWYYYNEELQLTQWEPPPEGFRPASLGECWPATTAGGAAHVEQLQGDEQPQQEEQPKEQEKQPMGNWPYDPAVHVYMPRLAEAPQQQQQQPQQQGMQMAVTVPNGDALPSSPGQQQAQERLRPRMEGTGLMPGGIPRPEGTHLRFESDGEEEVQQQAAAADMQQAAGPRPVGAAALGSAAEQARLSPVSHLVSDMGLLSVDSDASTAAAECDAAEAAAADGSATASGASLRQLAPAAGGAKPGGGQRGGRAGGGRRPVAYRQRRVGTVPGDLPRQLEKYWLQRYSIFSRFDEGIRIDAEGWYSATPEVVARHQARRAAAAALHSRAASPATLAALAAAASAGAADCVALDPFAGVGGNVIAFAQVCKKVIAVEIDPQRMAILRNNAEVYGVAHKVQFIQGDFFKLAPKLRADIVFYSPPWGGPQYARQRTYDIDPMGGQAFGLPLLLQLAFERVRAKGVIAFMPRNTDLSQVSAALPHGRGDVCEVERAVLNGVFKGISIYYGCVARDPREPKPQVGSPSDEGMGNSETRSCVVQ